MLTHSPQQDERLTQTPDRQRAASRSTWVSVGVNLGLSLLQITAGGVSHSQALVADGIHSLTDLLSDAVVLLANRHSHRDADQDHHYGHYRYENAASMILGLLLLIVGGGMLWAAGNKIQGALPQSSVGITALAVALVALVTKEMLFRYLLMVATRVRSSMLVANAWHARSDALSSLVVALGIVGNLYGWRILDPIAALFVGLMVLQAGARFAWDALNDLMDRAASAEETAAIAQTICTTPGVHGLHNLRTRKMGDLIVVDVHLEIDGQLTVAAGHEIAENAQQRVMKEHPVLDMMTHVDPVSLPSLRDQRT